MAAVPTFHADEKPPSFDEKASPSPSNSFDDEKKLHGEQVETAGGVLIDTDDIGAVFDGPRLIDLGEDGKERPIGQSTSFRPRRRRRTCFRV